MKKIYYKGFNEKGECVHQWESLDKYTVRGAMAFLSYFGYKPIEKLGEGHNLRYHWYIENENTGCSINATIREA